MLEEPATNIYTEIAVQVAPEPTTAVLDSAFEKRAIAVWTTFGVPHGLWRSDLVEPELRAIYFDRGRLHFAMKGKEAIAAFLALNPEQVHLNWCNAQGRDTSIAVRLVRFP